MTQKLDLLYEKLHDNASELQEFQGEWKEVVIALNAAKLSIEYILHHKMRIIFEIPTRIAIPDYFLDYAMQAMIHQFQNAIELHIKNPWQDSNPHIAEANRVKLRKIAEDIGWWKYLSQNENITLLMAKRLKDAIQWMLIPGINKWLSVDPDFTDNQYHNIRRHNERAGIYRPGFRSTGWKIRG